MVDLPNMVMGETYVTTIEIATGIAAILRLPSRKSDGVCLAPTNE